MNRKIIKEKNQKIIELNAKITSNIRELKAFDREIDALKEDIETLENQVLYPAEGNFYIYVTDAGTIRHQIWCGTKIDVFRYNQRNVFKTEEDAKEELKANQIRAEYFDLAEESWEAKSINWTDLSQEKWHHYVQNYELGVDYALAEKYKPNKYYFRTKEALKQAEKQINKENIIKYVLGDIK